MFSKFNPVLIFVVTANKEDLRWLGVEYVGTLLNCESCLKIFTSMQTIAHNCDQVGFVKFHCLGELLEKFSALMKIGDG